MISCFKQRSTCLIASIFFEFPKIGIIKITFLTHNKNEEMINNEMAKNGFN